MSCKQIALVLIWLCMLAHTSSAANDASPSAQCRFIGLRDFNEFSVVPSTNANETVLLSKIIRAPAITPATAAPHGAMSLSPQSGGRIAWNELIVSWNVDAPPDAWLKVEARAIYPGHETKFYTMGLWSRNSKSHPRESVRHQRDADGTVNDDTMVLKRPGGDVQLRLTLVGPAPDDRPKLKFVGLSFLDNKAETAPLRPHRAAWGKVVTTTERSQHSYPDEEGWCSPTSLSMVLTRWGELLHRPEMTADVPEVAAAVYDTSFGGTGNWPFNTAYAGSFPGIRAYVTRFSDVSELEDWIVAGIPVIISARWDLLTTGRKPTGNGHLSVCIGFTKDGDFVINDPATNFKKGQKVRHIYTRQNVTKAWKESNNTVYLVYPETAKIPTDRFGHWDKP